MLTVDYTNPTLKKYLDMCNANASNENRIAQGPPVFKKLDVEKDAKISIQRGGKSGFVYQRYNPRRTHQSSAPGEAPASDTGFLVNSIKRKMDGDGFGGEIASRAFYSKFLEFGTVKMLPRPFMFPALEKNRKKITQRLKQVIKSATMKPRK